MRMHACTMKSSAVLPTYLVLLVGSLCEALETAGLDHGLAERHNGVRYFDLDLWGGVGGRERFTGGETGRSGERRESV